MPLAVQPSGPPQIVFRCDASPEIGGGHVFRCLTLADDLAARGWLVRFVSAPGADLVVPGLSQRGFAVEAPDQPIQRADVLITDHYGLGLEFDRDAACWASRRVVFDDLADRAHACDLLLDPTPGLSPDVWRALVPEACHLLQGPAHAPLRPAFAAIRERSLARRRQAGGVARVLVSLGSTNVGNAAGLALEALALVTSHALDVDLVLGAAAHGREALERRIESLNRHGRHTIRMLSHVEDMAGLMAEADLAIGAGGTTSWERCALGLPAVTVEVADNQRMVLRQLERAGAVLAAGRLDALEPAALAAPIAALVDDPARLGHMSQAASALCDGRGVDRIVPWLLPEVRTRSGQSVRLRRMEFSDEARVLDWQSAPGARRHARNPEVPTQAGHRAWMASRHALTGADTLIVLVEGQEAGLLRLDPSQGGGEMQEDGFEVSILVADVFSGQGVAGAALDLARWLRPAAPLHAEVLAENDRSHALFARAGYQQRSASWYRMAPLTA